MPFTLVADIATLGNMGGRSYTQQLFDAERNERSLAHERELIRLAVEIAKAERAAQGKSASTNDA
jgi:hypothetical protein